MKKSNMAQPPSIGIYVLMDDDSSLVDRARYLYTDKCYPHTVFAVGAIARIAFKNQWKKRTTAMPYSAQK